MKIFWLDEDLIAECDDSIIDPRDQFVSATSGTQYFKCAECGAIYSGDHTCGSIFFVPDGEIEW